MAEGIDVAANREMQKYPPRELVLRALWGLLRPLFRFSPRTFFGWRRVLLRLFGARVGRGVHVYPSAVVYMPWHLHIGDWSSVGEEALIYNLGPVSIGSSVTISHRAHLCAGSHDYTRSEMPLLKPPIHVEDHAWICAGALVGPGVRVGEGAVVGAGSVVHRDVADWTIVAGNPAREIGKREMEGSG